MGQSPTQHLGDFELVREIGRGGMGVVYEARQGSLNRKVALKVLGPGLGLTGRAVERFRHEAEAAARLHHTHIVPVYATGEQDGIHYYAMELIEGPSLDRVLRLLRSPTQPEPAPLAQTAAYDSDVGVAQEAGLGATSLSSGGPYFDTVARMVAGVADALDYAHRQGVIHRDVKPGNLLLSHDGRLSLNDFGLARMLEQPGMTMTGELVGTPLYMAPEQIAVGRVPIDHRTDVYSLGATLYEMLTLQPPFRGERREQVIAQVLHKEPPRPRRVNPRIPVDLETICLKALDKDPDRRYQSAGAMAEDLRRYLQRFTISARRVGPIGRLGKWISRHPALAGASTAILLLALVAGFFACLSWQQHEQLRQQRLQTALKEALEAGRASDFDAAERAIEDAEDAGASAGKLHFLRGHVALQRGHTDRALEHLERAAELLPADLSTQALLTRAYHVAGQMDRFHERIKLLDQLPPQTPEDVLFQGWAMTRADARHGLSLLNEAIKQKDSLLARLIRADAAAIFAEDHGSLADMELALADLAAARHLAPGIFKGTCATGFWVNMHAAVLFREKQLPLKRAQALEQARVDAELLDESPRASKGYLIVYYAFVQDDEAVLREYRRWKPDQLTYFAMKDVLHTLVRKGDFPEARRLLGASSDTGRQMMHHVERGVVEALAQEPDRALAAYHQALRVGGAVGQGQLYSQVVLLLLGRKDQVRRTYQERRSDAAFVSAFGQNIRSEWRHKLWAFSAGALSQQDMEASANTRRRQCEAWFFIGLARFADGDRASAADYFKKCVDTDIFHFLEHRWSRSLLMVMQRHPDWPRKRP
jgi:tetratricopeptide (TPR) repeat protein